MGAIIPRHAPATRPDAVRGNHAFQRAHTDPLRQAMDSWFTSDPSRDFVLVDPVRPRPPTTTPPPRPDRSMRRELRRAERRARRRERRQQSRGPAPQRMHTSPTVHATGPGALEYVGTQLQGAIQTWVPRGLAWLDGMRSEITTRIAQHQTGDHDPWGTVYNERRHYFIRYADPATDGSAAYTASIGAFYNSLDSELQPVHDGVRVRESDKPARQGRAGVQYHDQVALDFERQPNQYLFRDGQLSHKLERNSDHYYEDVAEMLFASAKEQHHLAAGERVDRVPAFDDAAVRQRIARALHTRTQTFEADYTTMLTRQVHRQTEGQGNLCTVAIAHTYEVTGSNLKMVTYNVLQSRVPDLETDTEARTLQLVRREGSMSLRSGELEDERVFISYGHELSDVQTDPAAPQGVFQFKFPGGGATSMTIAQTQDTARLAPLVIPQDLV